MLCHEIMGNDQSAIYIYILPLKKKIFTSEKKHFCDFLSLHFFIDCVSSAELYLMYCWN